MASDVTPASRRSVDTAHPLSPSAACFRTLGALWVRPDLPARRRYAAVLAMSHAAAMPARLPNPPVSSADVLAHLSRGAAVCTTSLPACWACIMLRMAERTAPRGCTLRDSGAINPRAAAHDSNAVSSDITGAGTKSRATMLYVTSTRSMFVSAPLHTSRLPISAKRPLRLMEANDAPSMPADVREFSTACGPAPCVRITPICTNEVSLEPLTH